jgi:hypothetical protein
MTLASKNTFNAIANGIVNVPLSAILGTTVMRVRVIYANPNTAQPCGNYFGEVEDYTVNLTYCGARAADGTGDDWIENVSLNYISNTTGKTTYSDYKEIVTPLYTDNSYELSVKINFAFDLDTVYAWIDYDRNNSFTINERIMMSNLVANSKSTSSGIIYIPANTPTGETRLRVRVIYANPNPPDPCNAYWGEVEDYVVKITNNQGQGECPPAVTLGKELISLASGVYKAANTINTTSKIANNKTVVMPAGKSIIMNPGFIAEKGAVLTAEIKPCSQ